MAGKLRLRFSEFVKISVVSLFCTLVFRNVSRRLKKNRYVYNYEKIDVLEDLDPGFLLFNRVPKTGSELIAKLLLNLGGRNGFYHKRYGSPQPRRLGVQAQVRKLLKCRPYIPCLT